MNLANDIERNLQKVSRHVELSQSVEKQIDIKPQKTPLNNKEDLKFRKIEKPIFQPSLSKKYKEIKKKKLFSNINPPL